MRTTTGLNERQVEILEKEFEVNSQRKITRLMFENLSELSMFAWNWSDKQMQELADKIGEELNDQWVDDDTFEEIIETEAAKLGMRYYINMDDDERAEWEYTWMQIDGVRRTEYEE